MTTSTMRLVGIVAAATLLPVMLVACLVPAVPTERVLVGGDSLTIQAGAAGHLDGMDVVAGLGWQAEHVHHGADGHEGVEEYAVDPARAPGTLVIALGHNDAPFNASWPWADGWTHVDAGQMHDLTRAVHATTCVAWVLPHYAGTAAGHQHGIEAYRAWVIGRGQPTVDWRPVAQANPHYVASDGIHLTAEGAAAYAQVIREAAGAC